MTIMLFVLMAGLAGTGYLWSRRLRQDRPEQLAAVADRLGLAFVECDDRDPATLPFELFRRGDQRRVANLMSGTIVGRRTRVFDYDDVVDGALRSLSCAIAEVPEARRHVGIVPHHLVAIAEPGSETSAVAAGDPEFDGVFEVRADDPQAPAGLLVEPVREFLLQYGKDCVFEVADRVVVCATERLPVREMPLVLKALCAFLDVVPGSVSSAA